jgi:S-adenosyl-L-methionine hydrolase (adenosine-forming)
VVDLAHGIRGVRAGSVVLRQSVVAAPDGAVHLAVVDPGVGTERRGVAVTTERGDVLVGPDNGLLPPAADALGGASGAFELTDPRYRRRPVSSTFHGRDICAPAAAFLCVGVSAEELGPAIDPSELVRVPETRTIVTSGCLEADVARIDWYGNLQLLATEKDLASAELGVRADISGVPVVVGRTFADAEPGGLVVYVDSSGHVAIARNGGSARELLQGPERVTLKRKT